MFIKRFGNKFDEANLNFKALIKGYESETIIKRSDKWEVHLTKRKFNEKDCKFLIIKKVLILRHLLQIKLYLYTVLTT